MMPQHDPKDPQRIRAMGEDRALKGLGVNFLNATSRYRYTYNFSWLGLPVIQYPQDLIAMQEIIWSVRPELIVETGIAHGGSLVFYASMLQLVGGTGRVLGIDVDIRAHNRERIEAHPLASRIDMLQGSSTDPATLKHVHDVARGKRPVLVVLDSNHTHAHVAQELQLYAPLVTQGSYLVVFDTVIEQMPADAFPDRPWGIGNNPWTAVQEFLRHTDRFVADHEIDDKLLISVAPGGYLRCVKG